MASIDTAMQSAASGMHAAGRLLGHAAHEVATLGVADAPATASGAGDPGPGPAPAIVPDAGLAASGGDLLGATVDQVRAVAIYQANAASFRASQSMTDALLDITA